ncbi:alanyl-tRNA editing protein [Halorubrum gandharaense]
MTEQLHLADDDRLAFEATVERALDDRVVLDRTAFYPTGGGQPHDTGTLELAADAGADQADGTNRAARWRVTTVEKRDTVYHTLEPVGDAPATPPEGAAVSGKVDAERRRNHSRYHTAQHLLSAVLLDLFDAETTGNQLYADHAHLDAASDRFSADDLDRIERRLNELVAEDRPVRSYTMARPKAEATLDPERTRIELLPDSITELRIVEVGPAVGADDEDADAEPFDRTACAGTHVDATGEIGEVVVTGRETKGSAEERVNFVLADHAAE